MSSYEPDSKFWSRPANLLERWVLSHIGSWEAQREKTYVVAQQQAELAKKQREKFRKMGINPNYPSSWLFGTKRQEADIDKLYEDKKQQQQ